MADAPAVPDLPRPSQLWKTLDPEKKREAADAFWRDELVAYHLAHQRPMMGSFLDALGIAHDEGIIAEDEVKPPSPEALSTAAKAIAASYPAADVALYLSTLVWQDPDTWGALADLPECKMAVSSYAD